jgi:hypothetical protein
MKLRWAVLLVWIIGALMPIESRCQSTVTFSDAPYAPGTSTLSSIFWVRGEYLLWWLKDQGLPPLVTTSATQASVGRLGFGDTSVLYGGDVDGKVRQGFRLTAGAAPWTLIDDTWQLGLEGSFFLLERNNNGFAASSFGIPVLARPFVDVLTGASRVEQVANVLLTDAAGNLLVRAVTGKVTISNPSDMHGSELNAALIAGDDDTVQVHFLAGARYLHFQESLNIREDLLQPANAAAGIPKTGFVVQDRFHTRNEFLGGQIGMRTLAQVGDFSLEFQGKVAFGSTHQSVGIEGGTTATVTGSAPVFGVGGLLALPTNIGHYTRDRFTVVPEIALNVGYQVTPWLRGFVGYNFLYWSSVVRPGPQVDLGVNPNFIPPAVTPTTGPARPAFLGAGSDLWVQGMAFGVELTY